VPSPYQGGGGGPIRGVPHHVRRASEDSSSGTSVNNASGSFLSKMPGAAPHLNHFIGRLGSAPTQKKTLRFDSLPSMMHFRPPPSRTAT
jgi:hypothetical protein